MRMYFDKCLTEITRIIGYNDVPADKALEQMKPLMERYGKQKVYEATVELLDVDSTKEPAVTRLKADVRRFAFQLLGPPPDKRFPPPLPPKRDPSIPSSLPKTTGSDRTPDIEGRPLKQPRAYVIKLFQEWLKQENLVFIDAAEMKRTSPNVRPHVGSVDFIVLRGDAKMLVTVRAHLQAKNIDALRELQKLFGPEYTAIRFWPNQPADAKGDLLWREYPVNTTEGEAS